MANVMRPVVPVNPGEMPIINTLAPVAPPPGMAPAFVNGELRGYMPPVQGDNPGQRRQSKEQAQEILQQEEQLQQFERARAFGQEQAQALNAQLQPIAAPPAADPGVSAVPAGNQQLAPTFQPGPQPLPAMPMQAPAGGSNKVTRTNTARSTGESTGQSVDRVQVTENEQRLTDQAAQRFEQQALEAQSLAERISQVKTQVAEADRQRILDNQLRQEMIGNIAGREISAAKEKLAQREQELQENGQIKDFFEGRTGARILAAIAQGLGAFGAGLARTPNFAQQIISQAIEQDFAKQRSNIQNLKDSVAMARQGVQDAQQAKREMLEESQLREAIAREKVANKAQELMAKAGFGPEQIQQNQIVQDNLAKAQELRLGIEQAQRQRITNSVTQQVNQSRETSVGDQQTFGVPAVVPTSGQGLPLVSSITGKPLSDAERKALGFANRMKQARDVIVQNGGLSKEGAQIIRSYLNKQKLAGDRGMAIGEMFGAVEPLESQLSPKDAETWAQMQEFTAANLRNESGAAIGVEEQLNALGRFGRQVGDTGKVARGRLRNLDNAVEATAIQSGVPSVSQSPAGAPAQPAPGATEPTQQIDSAEIEAAKQWVRQNPNDPRAAQIRQRLGF